MYRQLLSSGGMKRDFSSCALRVTFSFFLKMNDAEVYVRFYQRTQALINAHRRCDSHEN